MEKFKNLNFSFLDLQKKYNIQQIINELFESENKIDRTIISKIELLTRSIEKKLNILKKVNLFFYSNKNDNMCLLEKYLKTEKIYKNEPFFVKAFKVFKVNKPFKNFTYINLLSSCNSILNSNKSLFYIKYKRFIDNYIFNCLKTPINYTDLQRNLPRLEVIINNIHKYRLIQSKYSNDFFNEILNNSAIDENYIYYFSNLINFKYNNSLLNKKKRWFDFLIKSTKLNEEYNLNLYYNSQKDIYEEYLYNFNIIKNLDSDLRFLKDNIKEDKYNEILEAILKGNNLQEILLFYKKLISTAKNNEKTFEVIKQLSNIEENVLSYCYNHTEKKSDINSLIKSIPIFKLYLEIEEEECENLDVIDLYNNYDNLISSICDDINKRYSILLNYRNDFIKIENQILEENNINNSISSFNKLNRNYDCYNNINKEIEAYLINKCIVRKVYINNEHIEVYTKEKKVFIKVSPIDYKESENKILEDINLYYFCKLNNIILYRVLYRNWWLDKFKELKNIEKIIME